MGKISFEKITREAKLLSPLTGFKQVVHLIEFRKDPLTQRWCRINLERAKRIKQAEIKTSELREIVEDSRKKCFFCPENLEKATPKFPDFAEGRIRVGSSCIFPNLFPFGEFHAIGIFSNDHYLELNQFFPKLLEDCFSACIRYFKIVCEKRPDVKYCLLNWNHLPPAAASIIHPHVQILADFKPTPMVKELIEKSELYHERGKSNYWLDLIEAEEGEGKRFISREGRIAWLASFAPQGNNEVTAIFSDRSSLIQLEDRDLSDFARGLSAVLNGYRKIGVESFNMTFFSGPNDRELSEYFLLNAKIMSRPNFRPLYTGDAGFMERFHYEPIVETMPEYVAEEIRAFFNNHESKEI